MVIFEHSKTGPWNCNQVFLCFRELRKMFVHEMRLYLLVITYNFFNFVEHPLGVKNFF
jgi:hypothetical protein